MDFYSWNNCIIDISLDSVFIIYVDIGLQVKDPASFIQVIRSIIPKYIKAGADTPILRKEILPEIESVLREGNMENDWNSFNVFAQTVFYNKGEIYSAWSLWQEAIKLLFFDKKYSDAHSVIHYQKEKLAEEYNSIGFKPEVHKYITEDVNQTYLSEWDSWVFKKFELDFSSDFKDPFIDIECTYSMNRFQMFWEKCIRSLDVHTKQQLLNKCQQIIDDHYSHLHAVSNERETWRYPKLLETDSLKRHSLSLT